MVNFVGQKILFKIKISDRNFTQRFDVFMTSLSSDNKMTVQECYIGGERCDYSLTYLFKQIVSHRKYLLEILTLRLHN